MKRINEYKKLFSIEGPIDLKELKTTYRTLIKEWHPDKFQDEALKEEANIKSLKIIDGYHFLHQHCSGNQGLRFSGIHHHHF